MTQLKAIGKRRESSTQIHATLSATRCLPLAMNHQSVDTSKITMQGVHVELTTALKTAIREKFSVLLRHNSHIVRIDVRLHHESQHGQQHLFSVTAQIVISGPDMVATAKGDDAYSVLDRLVEKLDQQLRDRHERRKEKRNHPHEIDLDAALPKAGG